MTAPHGTAARYRLKSDPCRCDDCRQANAAYVAAYREREGVREREAAASAAYRARQPKRERPEPPAIQRNSGSTFRSPDALIHTITLEEYRRTRGAA